jgi:type I restriction enzyme S subunit
MAAFPKVKLADCVDLLAGFAFKSQHFTDRPNDIPLVKGENVSQGCILWEISKRWSAADWPNLEKFQLRFGDVVVAMDRPWVPAGLKWAYIRSDAPKALLVQRCSRLRSNTPRLDQGFLRFVIGGPGFESYVIPITTGVNVPHISGKQILDYEFALPPIPVQQRIAGILSAYDELIENSQRRIKILESMARALYREWFVHFRFPGHENHPRVASSLGEIPQGWEAIAFTEIADVLSGGTPKTSTPEYWDGEIPFFTPRDTPDCFYVEDADKHVTELGLSKCASQLYPPDTVFITARGTVGKVALPSVPMAMNQSCYALRGKSGITQRFLFLMTLQQVEYLKTNTGGATFDTIVVDTFRRMQIAKPPHDLIAAFTRSVDAVFEQINTLQRQVQNLRRTRDLLLPRLLSGQIDLDAVDSIESLATA